MPTLRDLLSLPEQWSLVVTRPPADVAGWFASSEGQFYPRADFDRLAQKVFDLYASVNKEHAWTFRRHLDRRLDKRNRDRVAWTDTPDQASPGR